MSDFEQIDRSLVAIFDIEEFSERTPEKQALSVSEFLTHLSRHLSDLAHLQPDAFSTGDGAIISIGRRCAIDNGATRRFLRFVVDFTADLCQDGVILRTAVNCSDGDRIVFGLDHALAGQYIQVGDTINLAARVLSFCEPREIMFSAEVQRLLRHHDLEAEFPLHRNERLVTKHGVTLDTYTYIPDPAQANILYSPTSPLHRYKRFTAFPPIKARTLRFFLAAGLDSELRKVVGNAYDAMSYINETRTFISSTEVLHVLTRNHYDPEDTVYVVSRNDRPTGFWTQKRRAQYINFLAANALRHGGYINQTRVMVFDDDEAQPEVVSPTDILNDLERLHAPKTLLGYPASLLHNYDLLSQLIFGLTISKRYLCAIIPIPGGEAADASRIRTDHLGEVLAQYREYDAADGPMRAVITADQTYVSALIAEFENLLRDAATRTIR